MEIEREDWKNEKHAPYIEVKREGDQIRISVQVGKEVPHPNTFEHHIKFIEIYYQKDGAKPVLLARISFDAHGEANTFAEPKAEVYVKGIEKGKIIALAMCNIHGLWENEIEV